MAFVIREGDRTTSGGTVIAGSKKFKVEGRMAARLTDPVWCPACQSIGYIAEGSRSFNDASLPVATEGHAVQCGCPFGSNRLVASQSRFQAGDRPPVKVPVAEVSPLIEMTHKWAEAIRAGRSQNEFADALPRDLVKGLSLNDSPAPAPSLAKGVEPGFHIVQQAMARTALEAVLFEQPGTAVLDKFRSLNPQLSNYAKPGQLIVLSDPRNTQCTREEALLMEAAAQVNNALEPLTDKETEFMIRHREEIETFLTYSSTSIGVGQAMFARNLWDLKDVLSDIEALHQRTFKRDGHLHSPAFFAERRQLFAQLDSRLTLLTKKGIGFPEHPNLKKALGISSRSLVHHWSKAGASGQIPGYATHIEGVSKAAKYVKYGGWIGTALGGGGSYMTVQDVCRAGDAEACKRVKFTESGSFIGGVAGGALAGAALTGSVAGGICVMLGVPTAGLAPLACGLAVVGVGSWVAGEAVEGIGESVGEVIYEISK